MTLPTDSVPPEGAKTDAYFRRIAENLDQVIWVAEPGSRRTIYLSPAFARVWGRPLASAYENPRAWIDAIHPEDRGRILESVQSPPESRIRDEFRIVRPDGEIRWIRVRGFPILGDSGEVLRVAGLSEDVTETRAAEAALRAMTAQLEAVSETLSGFLTDGDWRAASARLLRAALGQTGSEYGFIGVLTEKRALRILVHEGLTWHPSVNRAFYEEAVESYRRLGYLEFTNFENLFGRVLTSGEVVVSNDPENDPRAARSLPPGHPGMRSFLGVPIRRGASVVGMLGIANRPAGYAEGEVEAIGILARAAGILFEAYRLRTREAELERQILQAQRIESVGTLAAGVAHEINNPLTYVLGALEEAERGLVEGADPAVPRATLLPLLREALEGTERVARIVRDLKTFGRIDDAPPTPLDVRSVVERAVQMAGNQIRFRARLVVEAADVPAVRMQEGRLVQVLLNLLVNAAQAVPEGHADRNEIRVRVFSDAGEAVIEISDTGHGVPSDVLERIFDPFFTTKSIGEGSGLGLSVCHNIVTAAGGRIEVESAPGRGTTFAVRLPAAVPGGAVAAEAPESASSPTIGRRGRVLVVDDEAGIRTSIVRILERSHRVVAVASGREAVETLARDAAFDVILCDLMMPEMTGMEVHATVAARWPALADRMVFVTGGAFIPSARAFLERVPNRRIEKPFRGRELAAAVADAIAGETRPPRPAA